MNETPSSLQIFQDLVFWWDRVLSDTLVQNLPDVSTVVETWWPLRPQRKIYISFILLKPIILVNKDDKQHVCTSVSTCKQWFDFPTMNPLSNCLRSNLLCRMEEAEPAQHFNACHRAGLDVHCFIVPFMQLFSLLWLSTHFMYSSRCCTTNYFYHGLILRWLPDNNHNAVLYVGREGESQSFQENKKWKEKHHVKGLERRQSRC